MKRSKIVRKKGSAESFRTLKCRNKDLLPTEHIDLSVAGSALKDQPEYIMFYVQISAMETRRWM
jgi:hypothetical protein